MISADEPNNSLPKLPPPDINLETIENLKLCIEAGRALSRLDGQTSTTFRNFANALNLIKLFSVPEAVASSAVENIITTVADALQARALPKESISPAIKETDKYTEAIALGASLLHKKGYLATNDYIDIQDTLGLPQKGIRKLPGYKIASDLTHDVYYTPPEGEVLIRTMLKDFEDYFNDESSTQQVLIKVALIHYQFESIHPFPDGNGRTGRILMPLYLVKHGYLRYPILFLSEYIFNNKAEYYQKLRDVTFKGEWNEWVEYILKGIILQANKTSEALDEVTREAVRYEGLITEDMAPKFRQRNIIDFLFANVAFNIDMLSNELGVSINTASAYLNSLVKAGLLDTAFVHRKKIFFIPKVISILGNTQK
jgi:Fic family protein